MGWAGWSSYNMNMVRKAGAKEAHVLIGSPPSSRPAYLGIDMASRKELIAAYKTVAGVEAVTLMPTPLDM